VKEGAFREDLFNRVNVFTIAIPPLREHVEDIPALAWAFVEESSRVFGKRIAAIAEQQSDRSAAIRLAGNVREPRNVIERAMILATSCTVTPNVPCVPSVPSSLPSTRLVDVQTRHMTSVLESCGWRVRGINGAATMLDTRMAKLGISRPWQ
jgi:formate hydrogenlyase transcriptional activator